MSDNPIKQAFLDACNNWLCDGYAVDLRYCASRGPDGSFLWGASIRLDPLPKPIDNSLQLVLPDAAFGQVQGHPVSKAELLDLLRGAADGRIQHGADSFALPNDGSLRYQSEMLYPDRPHSELHLQVLGGPQGMPSPIARAKIDTALRLSSPPFDGLTDICNWLALSMPNGGGQSAAIEIRVGLPADLIIEGSGLAQGVLRLTIHAHPAFDTGQIRIALRESPSPSLISRRQAGGSIVWGAVKNDRREGCVEVALPDADAVIVMLMIGDTTVRRRWFLDPSRSRNNRLLALQTFDKDLKMVRNAVEVSTDPYEFERGIAALLFMMGFSPGILLETNAPDLVVATPNGRLLLVECTTRVSDFASKIGKLVDRRGQLQKALQASGHFAQVDAALICRLPRDQIAAESAMLQGHNIFLIAGEELTEVLARISIPIDPDKFLQDELDKLSARRLGE